MKDKLNLTSRPPAEGRAEQQNGFGGITGRTLPFTFKWQAVLFLLPLIIIISAIYTLESISTERKILRDEIINKGSTIAGVAARTAELPLLSQNLEQLTEAAGNLTEIKDVSFVSFIDMKSRVLLSAGKAPPLNAPLSPDSRQALIAAEHDDYFEFIAPAVTVRAKEELFLFDPSSATPAIKDQIGWVRIGLSKEIMHRSEQRIIRRSAMLAVLFSCAGAVLLYLLVTLATRPLYILINAIKDVHEGEYSEIRIALPNSEIGRLATEFNRMSNAIRERENQLQENILELEQSQDILQENMIELEQTQEQLQYNVQELEKQIEARKAVEAELMEHRNRLEEMVGKRTEQLTSAKEQAEAASRAKSEFLSSMSHELRTPLNAILGYAQILKRQDNITDPQQHQLEIIRNSGEHLLMLINDILDVSKIEAGKMEIITATLDLPLLLTQVYSLTRLQAEEKELRFNYEPGGDLPHYVLGDERKLRQILLNLLSNAVKYTRKGGISLKVTYSAENGGWLHFEVIDTGIGIPHDKIEAIFEPFTQLATSRQVREGTGLGLNITRQLLSLMHGSIGVESEVGLGSVFRVTLPLPQVAEQDASAPKQRQEITGYEGERKRILIVDDNINNASMLISLLEPLGFAIAIAGNGTEALQQMNEQKPDLVIMDLVMPEMDGTECVADIRKKVELSDIKIIGASATVTASETKEQFAALCDAFLPKPIPLEPLLARISDLLGINWIMGVPRPATHAAAAPPDRDAAPLQAPPPEKLQQLHEPALMGDVRGIQAWAAQLAETAPQYERFANRLRELAGAYRTKEILALLNEHMR